MSKVPGIANVPILGQLFRSKNFNHSIVELVIIVTATVVDPLASDHKEALKEPMFVVPNLDSDTFDASAQHDAKQPPTADSHSQSTTPQQSDGR
jgi:pilus assembly protein CpaC